MPRRSKYFELHIQLLLSDTSHSALQTSQFIMLLTIITTASPATDLGYLLHKNPARLQSFDLSFGTAQVFYSEANAERCAANLLLDIDPVRLVLSLIHI